MMLVTKQTHFSEFVSYNATAVLISINKVIFEEEVEISKAYQTFSINLSTSKPSLQFR
jgi:hypothetical protein